MSYDREVPMENIFIAVATHKPYWMPQDPLYTPVQAGAFGKESLGWQRDDAGEHISQKNETYCELTALYWMWKNVDADIYGLAHYRRYLAVGRPLLDKHCQPLTEKQILHRMREVDILLPKKRHYWIETNESQYVHAHHAADLAATKAALAEVCPEALPAWACVMKRRSGHRFNLFLMRKARFHEYCAWLFPILFQVEAGLDIAAYSPRDRRVFGYLSERLLDVWLLHRGYAYRETRTVHLETQRWGHKIVSFVKRKFARRSDI
ncbi:MAG: DUF4422 domain-containing protein [Oscillospiraceae bacterium]|nr:DUF4422 domain-containing protein [Oscillospiraceae bacterium]